MKLLFLGYAVSAERCFRTPGSSAAANKYQLGLLGGVTRRMAGDVTAVTRLPVAVGHGAPFFVCRTREELFPGLGTTILPMLNLPFVKQFWSALAAARAMRRWGRRWHGEDKLIVGYNLNSFLGLAAALSARAAGARFLYLFTDPPYTNVKKGPLWKAAYRANSAMTRFAISRCDGIVAVNEGAAHAFAPGKPFCVIEGGVTPEPERTPAAPEGKTLVYGGGLSPHNGLENLIDGFLLTSDPQYRLAIYGRGVLGESLRRRAAGDGRISFPGFVSAEEMAAAQRRAAALVNPRPSALEICRTTFPSKLMEYLASGRPVLTTRLPGIPREYWPHLAFVGEETPEGFARAIDDLLQRPEAELAAHGADACRFVLLHKNWDAQAERFCRFARFLAEGAERR